MKDQILSEAIDSNTKLYDELLALQTELEELRQEEVIFDE